MSFEWKETIIGETININPRYQLKKGDIAKKISMADIDPFTRKVSNYEIAEFTSGSRFKNGDTLLARITPCLENGKTALVSVLDDDEIAFGSTEFIVLNAKEEITINDFVYYLSISPQFRGNAIKSMTGTSGRQRAQLDAISNWRFNLPSLIEQIGITKLLTSLDNKIELNNAINKNLEEMAQALFNHWFVDFEFPNENGEPYKSSGGEFEESELGLIPKGWSVCIIGQFLNISTTSIKPTTQTNTTFEHYSLPAYDTGRIPVFESGSEIKSNKYKVYNNSILVSKLNPATKRVWNPYSLTDYAICSTEFINYVPINSNLHGFCYSILNSESFQQYLISNATGSTNSRQRVSPRVTLNYKTAYSGKEISCKFNDLVSGIYNKIKKNLLENKNLATIRDTLLPKLMSGEIRVSLEQDHSDPDLRMVAESAATYQT